MVTTLGYQKRIRISLKVSMRSSNAHVRMTFCGYNLPLHSKRLKFLKGCEPHCAAGRPQKMFLENFPDFLIFPIWYGSGGKALQFRCTLSQTQMMVLLENTFKGRFQSHLHWCLHEKGVIESTLFRIIILTLF